MMSGNSKDLPARAPAPSSAKTLAQQILNHEAPSYTFTFSPFLRKTHGIGLAPNRPACKAFAAGNCVAGASCPDRHVPAAAAAAQSANSSYNSLVCKHWLRALCKKGDSCEFLHEYNLRKMPECNFFVRHGYCSNGDECLYLHIDPSSKLPPCPHYDRGFCPLGPECSKKHVRKVLCPYYLAGFCPDGKACKEGAHPRWDKELPRLVPKSEKEREDALRREKEEALRREQEGSGEEERDGRGMGRDDSDRGFRSGRGGNRGAWRGRGDKNARFGRGGRGGFY